MTTRALLAYPIAAGFRAKLETRLPVLGPIAAGLTPEQAAGVRVLITMGSLKTDAALMDGLPALGLICCFGTGYEGVDLVEAARRGIRVTHSPGANATAVAEQAMALLLAACRQTVAADRFVREGRWSGLQGSRMPPVHGLAGRKVGVFGLGAIGMKIAERAAVFEAEIAYHNRSRRADVPYAYHATLQSLAEWADILMVAARADSSNRHAVSREVLRALGPHGIVVNIARGSIIDEAALIDVLQKGELGSAGLDVFEHEPSVPEALTQLPQVVLTPHVGGATFDAHAAMQGMVIANIAAFLSGKPLPTPVPEMK